MEKEFIPYELAVKLKELGFNEKCFGWWSYINGTAASFYGYHCNNSELIELNSFNKNCTAPTWQQAFDWFRDKGYGAFVETWINGGVKKFRGRNNYVPLFITDVFDTYELARLECLKKLIELVEN